MAGVATPSLQLVAFSKVFVPAGGRVTAFLRVDPRNFAVLRGASTVESVFLDDNVTQGVSFPEWKVVPQNITIFVGGQQPDLVPGAARAPSNVIESFFVVSGKEIPVESCGGGSIS